MKKTAVATLVVALCALPQAVQAAEYCVVCDGPAATYRCQVADTANNASDPRLQLFCISELAKTGGHDTCSVNRQASSSAGEPCPGELRVVMAPASPPQNLPPSLNATDTPPAAAGNPVPAAPADGPIIVEPPNQDAAKKVPQTVEELAGQTVKNSQENLKKAGDAIGGTGEAIAGGAKQAGEKIGEAGSSVGTAAKKTWNCLTSLFNDC